MDIRNRVKTLLKMCGHAFLSTIHERLDLLERQTQNASFPETQSALLQASIHTVEKLHELTDHIVVETNDRILNNPELGLMEFLYSYLPTRKAIAAGGAECLRACGYDACTLEPSQTIPEDAALVKLDSSLEPLGSSCCPVVVVGFQNRLETLVKEMRNRGYHWHIVLHRIPGNDKTSFYSNYARTAAGSSGSVFFFRDYNTFAQAQAWCSAVLPRTYFKPASSKYSATESIPRL